MSGDPFVDVLIVGAGLSGIGAAVHLARDCPDKTVAIWEARDAIGGTWDLFRYPGIRSDSDMFTLGYAFRPWRARKAIADGPSILRYIRDTAAEHGIDRRITFDRKMVTANWSSREARWIVIAHDSKGATHRIACRLLFLCTGYYRYDAGHDPDFAGRAEFKGRIVHPQFWPADLDHAGKRIVVIGSGATAVTLVPELAKTAARVTMLQRSPGYVVSRPSVDPIARLLQRVLPARAGYALTRWKNIALQSLFYGLARKRPARAKRAIVGMVAKAIGPERAARHFTPGYAVWDQRLCLVPDGDLFAAINAGTAEVVTDRIARFERDGIRLESGGLIPADIVVTATGLVLELAGGADIRIDGAPIDLARCINYRGVMLSGIPNLAVTFGYTNASWTLKADLTSAYVTRLLNAMDARGMRVATPVPDGALTPLPMLDFTSGYVRRAIDRLPKQGDRPPWRLHQNYFRDIALLRRAPIEDGVLRLSDPIQMDGGGDGHDEQRSTNAPETLSGTA